MENLDVKHYLDIYTIRNQMQEDGLTNPSEKIKKFTKEFLKKLKSLPLDEKIILKNNSFFDKYNNLIMKIPVDRRTNNFP